MLQHGYVKGARCRRPRTVSPPLYDMTRRGKSVEAESRLVAARERRTGNDCCWVWSFLLRYGNVLRLIVVMVAYIC